MAIRKGDWKLVKMSDDGHQQDPALLSDLLAPFERGHIPMSYLAFMRGTGAEPRCKLYKLSRA